MARAVGAFLGSRFMYFFGVLILLAAIAGIQTQYQQQKINIPPRHVPAMWCQYDGGTKSAFEYVWNKGVYHITCQDNTQLTGGPN